jgi:hypothetical protein
MPALPLRLALGAMLGLPLGIGLGLAGGRPAAWAGNGEKVNSLGIAWLFHGEALKLKVTGIFRYSNENSRQAQASNISNYSVFIFKQLHIKYLRSWFDRLTTNANI